MWRAVHDNNCEEIVNLYENRYSFLISICSPDYYEEELDGHTASWKSRYNVQKSTFEFLKKENIITAFDGDLIYRMSDAHSEKIYDMLYELIREDFFDRDMVKNYIHDEYKTTVLDNVISNKDFFEDVEKWKNLVKFLVYDVGIPLSNWTYRILSIHSFDFLQEFSEIFEYDLRKLNTLTFEKNSVCHPLFWMIDKRWFLFDGLSYADYEITPSNIEPHLKRVRENFYCYENLRPWAKKFMKTMKFFILNDLFDETQLSGEHLFPCKRKVHRDGSVSEYDIGDELTLIATTKDGTAIDFVDGKLIERTTEYINVDLETFIKRRTLGLTCVYDIYIDLITMNKIQKVLPLLSDGNPNKIVLEILWQNLRLKHRYLF